MQPKESGDTISFSEGTVFPSKDAIEVVASSSARTTTSTPSTSIMGRTHSSFSITIGSERSSADTEKTGDTITTATARGSQLLSKNRATFFIFSKKIMGYTPKLEVS
ncbi:hypothetical protein [Leptospira idonii]|uniref:Uncharacterized protein n=1 Tax=Leptospira idonii TaxID=1193500 RepID=A0A4R9LZE1_9LEPT|nr:hypothetical protein [Leptospira idonii]TGN19730.1 hypothetical protein EHS15_08110 [Leptospira idonii]